RAMATFRCVGAACGRSQAMVSNCAERAKVFADGLPRARCCDADLRLQRLHGCGRPLGYGVGAPFVRPLRGTRPTAHSAQGVGGRPSRGRIRCAGAVQRRADRSGRGRARGGAVRPSGAPVLRTAGAAQKGAGQAGTPAGTARPRLNVRTCREAAPRVSRLNEEPNRRRSGSGVSDLSAIVKAYDIRGVVGEDLTEELVTDFGAAFALLIKPDSPSVVVGHDMRESSPRLADAFARGVTSQGLDVVSIGLVSTDELYFGSGAMNMPGAMFTASHNPARYNGIKLCRAVASPVGQESGLAEIRDTVEQGVPSFAGQPGTVTERDVHDDYVKHLHSLVDLSGSRTLKVVVDAGNGMGGLTVPRVFEGLPIEIVPLYFELDGTFPNHEANPLDPANIVDLQAKVREVGADVGLAFDGDADRCFVVDENGDPVPPSAITALVAVRELKKE